MRVLRECVGWRTWDVVRGAAVLGELSVRRDVTCAPLSAGQERDGLGRWGIY